MRRLRALGVAALAISPGCITGCVGVGFDLADLPADPIAIVYRTREESERRVELLARSKESDLKHEVTEVYDASFLRLEAAAELVGLGRTREQKAADLLGRMASLDARTEQVSPFEFGFRGDRPLDWSPDRRRLLFASLRSDSIQLYEWDRETEHVNQLTTGPEDHSTGCYLPEGRLAVVGTARVGGATPRRGASIGPPKPESRSKRISRIYVTEPGGGQPRPITRGPADAKPACSPDGSVIVYETLDANGRPSLAAVSPADGAPRVIAAGRDGDFTPDGAFVIYSAKTRVGWRLYQMHPDGQAKRPLGSGARDEHDPRVAPDGRYVVYVSDDEARQQLRVRTIDGRKDRPLIWNGDGITPVW